MIRIIIRNIKKEKRLASEPFKDSKVKARFLFAKNQDSKTQGSQRKKPRDRTVVLVRIRHNAGVELELAAAEVEDRGIPELAIRTRSELVTSTVDPEIVVVVEPFGVGQEHDADSECTETELVAEQDLTHTANRATTVTQTELGCDHEDVESVLLFGKLLKHACCLRRLAELIRTQFTFTVVVERTVTGFLELVQHQLDRFTVGGCERLPLRNGEPSRIGILRHGT